MNNIIHTLTIFSRQFFFHFREKKLFWKEKRTNKESSHQSNVKFLALQIQRRKIDDALFKYSPNVTNLPNPNLKDKICLCNTYDTVKLGTRFSSSFFARRRRKGTQFDERVGHGGWLIGPKLFWPEAFPTCVSSKLSQFIILVDSCTGICSR